MNEKVKRLVEEFFEKTDLGRDNANFVRGIPVLEHVIVGEFSRWYLFEEILKGLPVEDLHKEGWIYVHQSFKLSPYCLGLTAYAVAEKGLCCNAKNARNSKPPRWLDKLFDQCANLVCLISQECSGAVSLNDISTVAAGYLYIIENGLGGVRQKRYDDYELRNIWQSFVYNLNLPFRTGNSVFTNITLEFGRPDYKLRNAPVMYAGRPFDFTYSDVPPEYYDRINKSFIDTMVEGDSNGSPFTFPLITINYSDDFPKDNSAWLYLLDNIENFGGVYIQNYKREPFEKPSKWKEVNPYIKPFEPGMIYSNCCRVLFNIELIETITGSNPFHSGAGTGGIGVFAINMNRLLWLAKRDKQFLYDMLDYLLEVGQASLQRKRKWIEERYHDLYPYTSSYQKSINSLYNIFSVVGVHEGLVNAGYKNGIFDEEGKMYAHEIAQHMLKVLEEFMRRDRCLVCLEYAPSESASPRLAKKDLLFQRVFYEWLLKNVEDDPSLRNGVIITKDKRLRSIIEKNIFT